MSRQRKLVPSRHVSRATNEAGKPYCQPLHCIVENVEKDTFAFVASSSCVLAITQRRTIGKVWLT